MHEGNKITGQTEEPSSDSRKKKLNELKKKGVKISHGDRHPSKYIDEGKARRAEIKQYSPELEREGVRRDSADLEGQERAWVRVKDKKGKESWKYRKILKSDFMQSKPVEIIDKKTGQKKLIQKIDYERHGSFKKVSRALRRQNVEIELANVKEGKPPDQGKKTFYQDSEGKFHVMDVQEAFERRQGTFKRPTPQVTGYNRQGTLITSTAPKVEGNVASTSAIKEAKTKAQKKWGKGSVRDSLSKLSTGAKTGTKVLGIAALGGLGYVGLPFDVASAYTNVVVPRQKEGGRKRNYGAMFKEGKREITPYQEFKDWRNWDMWKVGPWARERSQTARSFRKY